MTPETFCEQFATFAEAPNGVAKLRELILQLAVQGKLGTHDENDEPASELLDAIAQRKVDHEEEAEEMGRRRRSTKSSEARNQQTFQIPQRWEIAVIDELVLSISNGCSEPQLKSRTELPVTRIETISLGTVNRAKVGFVEGLSADAIERFRLKEGDILFSHINSEAHLGKTAIFEGSDFLLHGTNLLLIRLPIDLVIPRYFGLVMKYLRVTGYFASIAQHAIHQASINQTKIRSTRVPLAPLAEQRRIVGKVDQLLGLCDELAARQAARREARSALVGATLDRLVSARSAAEFPAHAHRLRDHFDRLFDTPTTLPQLRQAILQLAVQGQLVPQDPNDEPIDAVLAKMWEHKSRLIESRTIREPALQPPVSDDDAPFSLPAGWRWQRWGNICDWITYGFTRPMSHVDSGPPIVTAKNVRDGFVSLAETHYADAAEFAALSPKDRPRKGDLLIVKDGATIGRAAIVEDDQPFCISQTVAVLWLESCRLYRPFLLLMIQAASTKKAIWEAAEGAAMPHLSITDFATMILPVPPLSEQKRIVSKVTELLSLCDALEAKLTQAESASTQLLSAAVHHLLQVDSRGA